MWHCWHDKEGMCLPGVGKGADEASGTGMGRSPAPENATAIL